MRNFVSGSRSLKLSVKLFLYPKKYPLVKKTSKIKTEIQITFNPFFFFLRAPDEMDTSVYGINVPK